MTIVDDEEPEDSETILIALTHTEGGSRILPSSDTVTVVILANDDVGGVIGFQMSSRSVIGREGGFLLLIALLFFVINSYGATVFLNFPLAHLRMTIPYYFTLITECERVE